MQVNTPHVSAGPGPGQPTAVWPARAVAIAKDGRGLVVLIGCYKLIKAILMLAICVTALRMVHRDLVEVVARLAHRLHLDPENRILDHQVLPRIKRLNDARLRVLGFGALTYALLYTVQGIGLLMNRPWAEWLTVASGVGLIPFEIYGVIHRPTWIGAALLASNIAMAAYLYWHVSRRCRTRRDEAKGKST